MFHIYFILEREKERKQKSEIISRERSGKNDDDNNESNEQKKITIFIKRDSVYSAKCKCKT